MTDQAAAPGPATRRGEPVLAARGGALGLRLALAFITVVLAAVALLAGLTAAFAAADVSNLASQQRTELANAIAPAARRTRPRLRRPGCLLRAAGHRGRVSAHHVGHRRDPAAAQPGRLGSQQQPPLTLIQVRPQRLIQPRHPLQRQLPGNLGQRTQPNGTPRLLVDVGHSKAPARPHLHSPSTQMASHLHLARLAYRYARTVAAWAASGEAAGHRTVHTQPGRISPDVPPPAEETIQLFSSHNTHLVV